MPAFHCDVYIRPRADILDPQGDAVERALASLGFAGASEVKVGRYITLTINADSEAAARAELDSMCARLLANPVTEDYQARVSPESGVRSPES